MSITKVTVVRGDTLDGSVLQWLWKDDNDDPVDLTGYSAVFTVKTLDEATTILNVNTSGSAGSRLTIPTPSNGRIVPDVDAATMALDPGDYMYDLQLTNGAVVSTIASRQRIQIVGDLAS